MPSSTARIGLESAMLTRMGDDHMGRFLYETLEKEGVDVSHVITDKKRLSAEDELVNHESNAAYES